MEYLFPEDMREVREAIRRLGEDGFAAVLAKYMPEDQAKTAEEQAKAVSFPSTPN